MFYFLQSSVFAQNDTVPKNTFDEYIKTRKGFFGKMIQTLRRDTGAVQVANDLQRNDAFYKKFQGRVIRHRNQGFTFRNTDCRHH
jgi:hypothetical protein